MTISQCVALQTSDVNEFRDRANRYGFDVAGPSGYGSFLIRERDGSAWLFGKLRGTFGRTVIKSVWTPNNVAVISGSAGVA